MAISKITSDAIDATGFNLDSNTLTIDATNNRVGVGEGTPLATLHVKNATDINMDNNAAGQLNITGNGYTGSIALNATGMQIYHNSDVRSIIFGTNETERVRIQSGGGISFNGDTASTNALDDYEEGDWIPTLTGTATALAEIRHASYIKIGRKVTAQAYLIFATDTDGSSVKITLPFTSHNVSSGWQAGVIAFNTGFTGDHVIIAPNSTNMEIRRGSGGSARLYSEYSTKSIIFGITYITA